MRSLMVLGEVNDKLTAVQDSLQDHSMAMHTKGIKLHHVKTWDGHTTRIEVRMPTRNSPQTWSRYLLLRACSLGWSMVKICRA